MLRLNRFSYLAPRTLEDTLSILQKHREDAVLMAGGTDVLINIKHRLCTPDYVIGVRHLPELGGLWMDDAGHLNIGGGVSLQHVEHASVIQARYPALAHAAHLVSTPQVRAVGTIGGNVCLDVRCNYYNESYEWRRAAGFCMKKDSEVCLVAPGGDRCWAVTSADTVPVLIALRADVTVVGPAGKRRMPLQQLYVDNGLEPLTLKPGEIVVNLHLPPLDGYQCVYHKFRLRQSFDFPLVGVATAIKLGADGVVEDARVVMTAVASYPQRGTPAEKLLIGSQLNEEAVGAAGAAIFRLAKPMDNTAGTIFHRKRMARILFERGVRSIAGLDEPRGSIAS